MLYVARLHGGHPQHGNSLHPSHLEGVQDRGDAQEDPYSRQVEDGLQPRGTSSYSDGCLHHRSLLTVPTGLEGELQPGHPQYMEFYKSSRINKAARTVTTEVDTVQG